MSTTNWQIAGKTALITGAARGIGAESARRLAARGMKVSLVGLEPEELATVAAECGPDAAWFEADVTDRAQLQAAVDGTVEQLGGIDVTIANAGVLTPGPVLLADPDVFERSIDINLLGVYRTVHACLPQIVERKGFVLVVSSVSAVMHGAGSAAYSAGKAGAEAFANGLKAEMEHHGVGVGIAYFSFIDTEMVDGYDRHPVTGGSREKLPPFVRKLYPLSAVGDAVVRGVERRSSAIAVPGLVLKLVIPLRGLLTRMSVSQSSKGYAEIEAAFKRDVAERGVAASAPTGAGGAAAARAASGD